VIAFLGIRLTFTNIENIGFWAGPPFRPLYVEEGSRRALNLNATPLNLDIRDQPGRGEINILLSILVKHPAGVSNQLLYLCIPYFFVMGGFFGKCSAHFL
jgi:hypothetical protein